MDDLIQAVINNDAEEVQKYLGKGIDPNGSQDNAKIAPLHFAAQHDAQESAIILIENGADIHAKTMDGLTPIDVAKLHSHDEMVDLLERAQAATKH